MTFKNKVKNKFILMSCSIDLNNVSNNIIIIMTLIANIDSLAIKESKLVKDLKLYFTFYFINYLLNKRTNHYLNIIKNKRIFDYFLKKIILYFNLKLQ